MSQKYRRVNSSNTASLKMLNRTPGKHKKERENEKYEDMIYNKRVELRKLHKLIETKDIQIRKIEDNIIENNKIIESTMNTQSMSRTMSINNPSFEYSTLKFNKKIRKIKEENSKLESEKMTLLIEINSTITLIENLETKIKKLNNKLSISNLSLGGKKIKYTKKHKKKRTRKNH